MGAASNKMPGVGLALVLLTLVLLVGGYLLAPNRSPSRSAPPLVLGELPEFSLTNELAQPITLANLRGQVWLADVIFTRCAGPCPKLSRRMSELQADVPAKFVSFTVDPEFDTPPILKLYAKRYGAAPGRWMFLTGTKQDLYTVIVKGLKLAATATAPGDQKPGEDFFVHSTKFVLIDRQGRVRAYYDGLDPAAKVKILADLKSLAEGPSS